MRPKGLKLILIFTLAVCTSCKSDYTDSVVSQVFRGNRPLPTGVSRIFIEMMPDVIINDAVKDTFSKAMNTRISKSEQLSLVSSPGESDLVLKVSFTEYSSEPVKVNSSGTVEKYKLRLVSFVWIISPSTGDEKVRQKKVDAELVYSELIPPVMSEYQAISALTDQLADRVISVVSTGFYRESKVE